MVLERVSWRLQLTIIVSLVIHGLVLNSLGPFKPGAAKKRLELTEVEFQEEIAKPTEIEKLMNQLTVPPKAEVRAPRTSGADIALAELEQQTFKAVVGLRAQPKADVVTESELTHLAALPKLSELKAAPAPAALAKPAKRIALVPSRSAPERSLEKIETLAELPPADFAPDIQRRNFQQPELIIKNVKAERRQAGAAIDPNKQLSLKRDAFIGGEARGREILHREYPEVPRWLEEKGVEVEVVLSFVVNPDGEVGDRMFVEKTSGYAELDRLAMEALKRFVFAPLPLNVKQVEQKSTITIRFRLHQK